MASGVGKVVTGRRKGHSSELGTTSSTRWWKVLEQTVPLAHLVDLQQWQLSDRDPILLHSAGSVAGMC